MKAVITKGINMDMPFKVVPLVVRTEKTGDHVTMSIADEERGTMLQVVVNDDVKKILREAVQ
jgi:hypothetical protein